MIRWQFKLIALFALTALVAIPFAWVSRSLQVQRSQEAIVNRMSGAGAWANYNPRGYARILVFSMPQNLTDDDLVHVTLLPQLEKIFLNDTQVTDKGLVRLEKLTSLQMISLTGTNATQQGIERLKTRLPNCLISTKAL